MRPSIIGAIFRKEILETLRDRRTLLMMIGLPILLYPMMIVGIGWFQESQVEQRRERPSTVAVWGEQPEALLADLRARPKIVVRQWASCPTAVRQLLNDASTRPAPALPPEPTPSRRDRPTDTERDNPVLLSARETVTTRTVDAVLVLWPGFADTIKKGGAGSASIYFDSVQPESVLAGDRLSDALESYRAALVEQRERDRGLANGFSVGIDVRQRNVASKQRRTGELTGTLLPFILIVMSLLGALYPAIDVTAGEKERGTMQTLMCAPVRPHEIIVGKFMTVWTVALITALVNVVSLAATVGRIMPDGELSIPLSSFALTFVMLIPVTFSVSALFLAVAAFARDFKDGQNFLMPAYMVLAMPAAMTMLPGVRLNAVTAFMPVLNIALLIKGMMLSEVSADLVFLTMLASMTYACLAVLLASRVFEQEQVLLGGQQSLLAVFGFERRRGRMPGPTLAIVAFAGVLVAAFYGSLALQRAGLLVGLLVTEYGFFLLPTLLLVFGFGFPARRTLALRLPPARALIGSVLLGVSAWTVAAGVLIRLLPPPESLARALERLLMLGNGSVPLWAVWLAIAVTPAICEELFFRGLVMSGLRRLGLVPALLISSLLFGLAHSSIYRLLPTAFLGLVFGYVVWRTGSIACSVVAHALNNGLTATLVLAPASFAWLNMAHDRFLPWKWTVVGCTIALVGLWLVRSVPQVEEKEEAESNEECEV